MFNKASLALIFLSLAKVCFGQSRSFNRNALGIATFSAGPLNNSDDSIKNVNVVGIATANTLKIRNVRGSGGNISQSITAGVNSRS
jgi:hypothetical protein